MKQGRLACVTRKLLFVAVVLGMLSAATTVASASEGCAYLAEGVYLADIRGDDGELLSRSVITFHRDGTMLAVDSNQEGIVGEFNPFTANQGEWECTGRSSLKAITLSFQLPGSEGPEPQLARVEYRMELNRRTRELSGTVDLVLFDLEQDPFRDAGTSLGASPLTAKPIVLPRGR